MSQICPPYLNKMESKLTKEVIVAERKELKAKKDYEFAQEYNKLCKQQLENFKNESKK